MKITDKKIKKETILKIENMYKEVVPESEKEKVSLTKFKHYLKRIQDMCLQDKGDKIPSCFDLTTKEGFDLYYNMLNVYNILSDYLVEGFDYNLEEDCFYSDEEEKDEDFY